MKSYSFPSGSPRIIMFAWRRKIETNFSRVLSCPPRLQTTPTGPNEPASVVLERIGRADADDFYSGEIASAILGQKRHYGSDSI